MYWNKVEEKKKKKNCIWSWNCNISNYYFFPYFFLCVLNKLNVLDATTDIVLENVHESMLLFELNCDYTEDIQLSWTPISFHLLKRPRINSVKYSRFTKIFILDMLFRLIASRWKMPNIAKWVVSRMRDESKRYWWTEIRARKTVRCPWFVISNNICYI